TLTKRTAKNIEVYRTELSGTIIITTDGTNYTVKTEKATLEISPTPTTLIPASSSISISVSADSVEKSQPVTVLGIITPPVSGVTVHLSYVKDDKVKVERNVTSRSDGSFVDTYTPDAAGSWSVTASWQGNENYKGSKSSTASFLVVESPKLPKLQIIVLKLVNTVKLGKSQTIKIQVLTEEGCKAGNAKITGKIINTSGSIQTFSGTANKNGIYQCSWKIGTTVQTGIYTIEISASMEGYTSITKILTFNVIPKKQLS
ncbi:MAG: hypothetical protein QXH91_09700, partial [Candidatus Bathyarchaeia archaeon]